MVRMEFAVFIHTEELLEEKMRRLVCTSGFVDCFVSFKNGFQYFFFLNIIIIIFSRSRILEKVLAIFRSLPFLQYSKQSLK